MERGSGGIPGKKHEWRRVTRSEPCPICKHADWCQYSEDGITVHCMRVESVKPAKKNGGWIHKLGEPVEIKLKPKREEARPNIDFHAKALEMFKHKRAAQTRLDLAIALGVSERSLHVLGVGFGADRRVFSSWPERDAKGKVLGIMRRFEDGSKKLMRWSHHGLYFGPPLPTETVYCPEGGSDTAALWTLGCYAVGRPSNVGCVDLLIAKVRSLKPKLVVVLGERDQKPDRRGQQPSCSLECSGCAWCWPGLYGARTTAKRLQQALRCEVIVRLPAAKDVRAWLMQGGRGEEFSDSLESPDMSPRVAKWKQQMDDLSKELGK